MNEPTVKACPMCGREAMHNCWHERLGLDSRVSTVEIPVLKALALAHRHLEAREDELKDDRLQVARYETMEAECRGQQAIDQLAAHYAETGNTVCLDDLRRLCAERGIDVNVEARP